MQLGLSIYFIYEEKQILSLLHKAKDNGFKYIFTSLHIPEEDSSKYINKIKTCINECKNLNLFPIVDISPRVLKLLNIQEYKQLHDLGIEYLRLDFGFSYEEIKKLSQEFKLIFNASTFNIETYEELSKLNIDFHNVYGCHNFYPKKYTGLTKDKVEKINQRIHSYGMKTIGFVMGDDIKRGPLFEGLPTIEELRNEDVFYNALILDKLNCDVVIVADFGLKDETFKQFKNYNDGYIEIKCEIDNKYNNFLNYIHHDRIDNSEYFIRSHESIYKYKVDYPIKAENTIERTIGDICISNELYLRYNGELEIMLKNLPADNRVNVVGKVESKYLEFIDEHLGIKLIKS